MLNQKIRTADEGMELLGELHRFAEQLGTPGKLTALGTAPFALGFGVIDNSARLREFLEDYCSQVLVPCELPAIHRAYVHASRYEVRELIASDRQLGQEPKLRRFASVSQCLGAAQLQKLRPLRDQRLVRRYREAVENGEAHGWHTIVYGLILALYSMPLRQGLIHYGQQIVRGFVRATSLSLHLTDRQRGDLAAGLCSPLPRAVESLLSAHTTAFRP
ncbi:MAG: hypothetical protein HY735_08660 [Verrucomicrobia bacterium]|nr:hypothetical protein [Verrucomicrobiota bacterium]